MVFQMYGVYAKTYSPSDEEKTRIGSWALDTLFSLNKEKNLGIYKIRLILVESWSVDELFEVGHLTSPSEVTLDVFILNHEEADQFVDEGLKKLAKAGYSDITSHIGYETRSALIYTNKDLGKRVYEEMMK